LGTLGAFSLPEAYANIIFGGFALIISLTLVVRAARMKTTG